MIKEINASIISLFMILIANISHTGSQGREVFKLPSPSFEGKLSLEKVIKGRRTVRDFQKRSLNLFQLSQILWAAQGITEDGGFKRASPSAGALYPLDLYVTTGKGGIEGLEAGIYHYLPYRHAIELEDAGDFRADLAKAALGQMWIARAPIVIVITAEYARTTKKYGKRGIRYALIEAGHAGENILLQARAIGLEAGEVGAFYDQEIGKLLKVPQNYEPLLIIPVGYK